VLQAVAQKVAAVMGRIATGTDSAAAVVNADLAIEAVTENLALKQKIFSSMDAAAPSSCIFASNTSSLSIAAIASATKRSDRFGGLHFFNPVPMMKLLEVIRTPQTTDAVNSRLLACASPCISPLTLQPNFCPDCPILLPFSYGSTVGKTVVQCGDTPGFIVNRLLVRSHHPLSLFVCNTLNMCPT
jgi:3-hydroxyacyl-CoA dehydrogenase